MSRRVDWTDPVSVGAFAVSSALREDRAEMDAATSSLGAFADEQSVCTLRARESLVVAGWFLLEEVFRRLAEVSGCAAPRTSQLVPDGTEAGGGEAIGVIEGPAGLILRGERVALTLMCRLSGIASLTRKFVLAVEGTGAEVLDTRKTTPCLRALEKYAVRMGGGVNHRSNLAEMAMIKDNHLAVAGGADRLGEIMERLRKMDVPVEIEVDGLGQLGAVLRERPGRILLDNMEPEELEEAVAMSSGSGIYLEASGGVTLDNVRRVAETGVDGISSGALTHSSPWSDIGFDWGLV